MNRNILLGCAVVFVALVAALVVAAFVLVPRTVSKAKKWIGAQMEEVNRRAAIEKACGHLRRRSMQAGSPRPSARGP
jgi:hypothetical protein